MGLNEIVEFMARHVKELRESAKYAEVIYRDNMTSANLSNWLQTIDVLKAAELEHEDVKLRLIARSQH